MTFEGICKLCGNKKFLRESHIFPNFVVSWLRETGSGYFRMPENPNIKYQDLPKENLLCGDCEQLFCEGERYFSKRIFFPYLEGKPQKFEYSKSLYYFLISVLWRVLRSKLDDYKNEHKRFIKEIDKYEEKWRFFLLHKKNLIDSDIHLFVTDFVKGTHIPVKGFNRYMVRGIDGTVCSNNSECYMYVKFSRFCVFAPLTKYDETKWVNTKIANGDSTWSSPQEIKDGRIGQFLVERIRSAFRKFHENISEKQRIKIHEYQKKNLEKVINSELGEVLLQDSFAPVDTSFFPKRKIRRNEPCPCGSNLKYKKCHGR
jgi:uncharacterized protein YchJ